MKLLPLLESFIPVKERILKLQQDLIELCDDVSDMMKFEIPFARDVLHFVKHSYWTRYAFIVTLNAGNSCALALSLKSRQLAFVVDVDPRTRDGTVVAFILAPKNESFEKNDGAPNVIDMTALKSYLQKRSHEGFISLSSEDEAVTGRQDGIDKLLDLFKP